MENAECKPSHIRESRSADTDCGDDTGGSRASTKKIIAITTTAVVATACVAGLAAYGYIRHKNKWKKNRDLPRRSTPVITRLDAIAHTG